LGGLRLGNWFRGRLGRGRYPQAFGGRIPEMAWHTRKEYIRINELVYSRALPSGPLTSHTLCYMINVVISGEASPTSLCTDCCTVSYSKVLQWETQFNSKGAMEIFTYNRSVTFHEISFQVPNTIVVSRCLFAFFLQPPPPLDDLLPCLRNDRLLIFSLSRAMP
jgi:hypothetical protein